MNARVYLIIFLVSSIALLISCEQPFKLNFPQSSFANAHLIPKPKMLPPFEIRQNHPDSVQLILFDTVIAGMDSTLGRSLSEMMKQSALWSDDYDFKLVMYLDKNLSFQAFNKIQRQLRLLKCLRITYAITDTTGISFRLPPIPNKTYRGLSHKDVELALDTSKVFNSDSAIVLTIDNSTIQMTCQNIQVNDLKTELEQKQKLFLIYDLSPSNTYQDYIHLLGFIYEILYAFRNEKVSSDSLDRESVIECYPLHFFSIRE